MAKLKDLFNDIADDTGDIPDDAVEVLADSVRQALDLAARELGVDVSYLDYEILEKGSSGFFGLGRLPYRVLVIPSERGREAVELAELERKLHKDHIAEIDVVRSKNADGSFKVRVLKSGIWLTVEPPRGSGLKVDLTAVQNRLYGMRITPDDDTVVEQAVKKASGKPVKIGRWMHNAENDSAMSVEVTEDEMRAYVHIAPPRYAGRHLDFEEIMEGLRHAGVNTGFREDDIRNYLEAMDYTQPLLAAEGVKVRHGKDAYVEYKVRVDKSDIQFEEDESGKVDFRNLDILENVVSGQTLAVKIPAEQGIDGRTVTGRIIPANAGKDIKIPFGKGTILTEDGNELKAEINGQVIFKMGKLSVDPVFIVRGDVSLETGNVVFLGSVVVKGNVQDNFEVKAAGNVEVIGTVQKAFIEAEGDIIVYQGISGRDEARIESTAGSVIAKFIQNARVIAERDVMAPEGIIQSRVDAGNRIISIGKKGRIVGGESRAANEINAHYLGTDTSTRTILRVGINPKVMQQIADLEEAQAKLVEEQTQLKLNLTTLEKQKRNAGAKFPEEKQKQLSEMTVRNEKITARLNEIASELEELRSYIGMSEYKGKICAEKSAYAGCDIYLRDQRFPLKDPYNNIKFTLQGNEIKLAEYDPPEGMDKRQLMPARRKR